MRKSVTALAIAAGTAAIHLAALGERVWAADFQNGFRVVGVEGGQNPKLYYAAPTGDVYFQWLPNAASGWAEPAVYLGNFFGGQPVPGDFVTGFHVVAEGPGHTPRFYYASSDGEIFHHVESILRLNEPPGTLGNFFFGQPVPADFQQGFRITLETPGNTVAFYYTSNAGDVYRQGSYFVDVPSYLGNFFGDLPIPTAESTFGKIKALYRR